MLKFPAWPTTTTLPTSSATRRRSPSSTTTCSSRTAASSRWQSYKTFFIWAMNIFYSFIHYRWLYWWTIWVLVTIADLAHWTKFVSEWKETLEWKWNLNLVSNCDMDCLTLHSSKCQSFKTFFVRATNFFIHNGPFHSVSMTLLMNNLGFGHYSQFAQ